MCKDDFGLSLKKCVLVVPTYLPTCMISNFLGKVSFRKAITIIMFVILKMSFEICHNEQNSTID